MAFDISTQDQVLRATWHDYREEGYYLITMVAEDRARVFGSLIGDSEGTATICLSPLGEVLKRGIIDIPDYYSEIEILDYVVMEDHCHICLHIKQTMQKHLGAVVRALKSVTTKAYLQQLDKQEGGHHLLNRDLSKANGQRLRHTEANNVDDSMSVIRPTNGQAGVSVILVKPLWHEGYHDRIVTRYGQVTTQRRYVLRNPARLWLKRHADHAMTHVREIRLPISLSLAQQLKDNATYWDQHRDVQHSQFSHHQDGSHYMESYVELVQRFLRRGQDGPFLKFRYCGDVSMLESGRPFVRVRISRNVTEEQFREEVERILGLCEHEGAIAVSPFISWSEKAILAMLRENGYDHIIVHGEAMWEGWKPQDGTTTKHHQSVPAWYSATHNGRHAGDYGRHTAVKHGYGSTSAITAVADSDIRQVYSGHCAFIAPWPDRPRSEKATKADCEVMNELCKIIEMAKAT